MTPTKNMPLSTDEFAVLMNRTFQSLQEWLMVSFRPATIRDVHAAIEASAASTKEELMQELKNIKEVHGDIAKRLVHIENDVEDIKLGIGDRAYRFDTAELDCRMVKVEEKLGIEPPSVRVPY